MRTTAAGSSLTRASIKLSLARRWLAVGYASFRTSTSRISCLRRASVQSWETDSMDRVVDVDNGCRVIRRVLQWHQ